MGEEKLPQRKRRRKKKRKRRLTLAVEWICLAVMRVVETIKINFSFTRTENFLSNKIFYDIQFILVVDLWYNHILFGNSLKIFIYMDGIFHHGAKIKNNLL